MGEILRLRWAEVDFERRRLFLAGSETGSKVVHLNGPALQVLVGLRDADNRGPENPYVIEGKKPGTHLVNLKNPWHRLRKAAGEQQTTEGPVPSEAPAPRATEKKRR